MVRRSHEATAERTVTKAWLSYGEVLSIGGLPGLLTAAMLSRLADRMLALAIVLYALDRFASPGLAGWMSFAVVAPGLAISPVAGVLLDRFGSAWGIVLDLAMSATLVAAIAAADWVGGARPAVLLTLVTVFSLTSPLSVAGIRTLLPRLVPPEARDRVNALDTAIFTVADLAGPALAGSLFAFLGASAAFTVIAIMFAGAALCAREVRDGPLSGGGGTIIGKAVAGVSTVL